MNQQRRPLLITMGDPSGVGPEVLLKSLAVFSRSTFSKSRPITVIGDKTHLQTLSRRLKLSLDWDRFEWVDLKNLPRSIRWGKVQAQAGRAAYEYLKEAVKRLRGGQARWLVTAPVSKEAIWRAGIPWVGHTEFLAEAFHAKAVMMFVTGSFRASLVTTHVPLKKLPRELSTQKVVETIRITQQALSRDFGIRKPRIGLAALNPHAGEGGLFGQEEKQILLPAARTFRKSMNSDGIVEGPLPVDSLIQAAVHGKYDAVVALYHDQALIPVKLLGWEEAVNVTLGLPFLRTSPVHGTAFDIAGSGKADYRSMLAALRLAHKGGQTPFE